MEIFLLLIESAFWAAIPAVGFAMIFNVPSSTLFLCGIGGAIAYSFRVLLIHYGLSIELSTFLSSTLIGVIGVYWSKKYIMPRPVYTVASIIPMIPGTYAFSTMISLVDMNAHGVSPELISVFTSNGLKTISIIGAIAFGLALPSLYYTKRKKPII